MVDAISLMEAIGKALVETPGVQLSFPTVAVLLLLLGDVIRKQAQRF